MSMPCEIQNEVQIKSVWLASAITKLGKWKGIAGVAIEKPSFFDENKGYY